jgi:hypothetical protein
MDPMGQFIIYQGQRFVLFRNYTTLDAHTFACPGNWTVKAGADLRNIPNLLRDPYELSGATWVPTASIARSLSATVNGLPMFLLTRTMNGMIPELRQNVVLPNSDSSYAFTVLISPGSVSHLEVRIARGSCSASIRAGSPGGLMASNCAGLYLDGQVESMGRGTFYTFFMGTDGGGGNPSNLFELSATPLYSSPQGGMDYRAGDSIYIGATRLAPVDPYCDPPAAPTPDPAGGLD